jgi:radical SAM protein
MHNRKLIRKPVYNIKERPFMVIWEITNACDLACRHCRAEAIPEVDCGTLTTDEGKALLDEIERFGKPRPIVILTGGDPFKRADLFELVRYGTEIGLPIAVSPSATPLLSYDNLAKLKEAGTKAISLSIDGSTPELHDHFRRVDGSFQMTLDGWQAAHDIGLKVQLNTTVTRYNLDDMPNIFKLVQGMGAMTWSVFFLVPTGRGRVEDEVTPREYEDVMNWLYDASKYLSAKTTEGHQYKRIVLQRAYLDSIEASTEEIADVMNLGPTYYKLKAHFDSFAEFDNPRYEAEDRMRRSPMHINAGSGFVFISRRGEIFPSGFMPIDSGDVRKESLVEVYRNSPLFQSLREPTLFDGKCGNCEYHSVCGGSRSRAYAVTGNPIAAEPFCTYKPGSFPYAEELAPILEA